MNHFKKSFRGYRVKEVEERIAVLETQWTIVNKVDK